MASGIVFDIRKFSIHDGPGIRTTVFLKGCSLRCRWCHNPEGLNPGLEMMFWARRCIRCGVCLSACPQGAISQDGSVVSTDQELMDKARHRQFTGVSNGPILSNLRALSQRGHAILIRIPLIPGINDDEENLRQIGVFAAALSHLLRVDLLPYHSMSSTDVIACQAVGLDGT